VTCVAFSGYGYVSLFFYGAEESFDSDLSNFLNTIDSFQFDSQFKY
jgi:hypothetical protein